MSSQLATLPMVEEPHQVASPPKGLLLYDGECGLCDLLVHNLLKISEKKNGGQPLFWISRLQGKVAQKIDQNSLYPARTREGDYQSIVFVSHWVGTSQGAFVDEDIYLRTDAVGQVLLLLGGGWRLVARVLFLLPRAWRDAGYKCVARSRRLFFGEVRRGDGVEDDPHWARWFLP